MNRKYGVIVAAIVLLSSLFCCGVLADEIQLPEDGQAYFTSIIVPPNWETNPRAKEIVAWFEQDTRLKSLKQQTHFRVYPTNDPVYRENLAHAVGNVPAVMVQRASGHTELVIWEGGQLPKSAKDLGNLVGRIFGRRPCPDGKCPLPKPGPDETQPSPKPDVVPDKPVVPVLPPSEPTLVPQDGSNAAFWVLLVVLVILTVIVANVYYLKKEVNKS